MIRKYDLRVGNYIQHGEIVYVVTDIQDDLVRVVQLGNGKITGSFPLNDVDGVPMSPNLLKSHKWVEEKKDYWVFKGRNPTGISYISGLLDIDYPYADGPGARVWVSQDRTKEGSPGSATYIMYFHQLQNFIFGLTTIELSDLIE